MDKIETVNIILCGLGGQGILFMTRVLARASIEKGFNVLGAETHGMAQRGGSVISHLRIGEVESSLIRTGSAQFLLSLEENEGYRNIPFLSKGARIYVNRVKEDFPRAEVRRFFDKRGILYRSLSAGTIAQKMGTPMASNLALLGYFGAFGEGPVTHKEMRGTIEGISPNRFKDTNLSVFDAGHQRGVKERES